MNVASKLSSIRQVMKEKGIDALIIPSSDPHQSEYVASHWEERAWISGFTGSAGIVAITHDHAGLWTDSRYFLQGELELAGTEFTLHKMYNQFGSPYIEFLADSLFVGATVAINGFMFSKASVDSMKKAFDARNISLEHRHDLISEVWLDRPALSEAPIEIHDAAFAGQDVTTKLDATRKDMSAKNVDYHLITALDDLAWTFNIRGKDVAFNPVVIAYGVVGLTSAHLFVHTSKLTPETIEYFNTNSIVLHPYDSIISYLNGLEANLTIMVDNNLCSQSIYESINATIIHGASIPKGLKAIKNKVEIDHVRNTMKKDGAAIAHTFYWLEEQLAAKTGVKETAFALKLAENRSYQPHYQGESFPAIIGYKSNGAIIHYHPEPDTCKTIIAEGILLADSGGQYSDGTTDITRTVTLSEPTADQMKHYTLILKGLVALSMIKFPMGTTGGQLDTLARQFLWSHGLNYLHGTGHGVGFYLNVHEGPQGFGPIHSERGKTAHVPGMLSSNEPGYYIEGAYGMRIENLMVAVETDIPSFLAFETLTLYPFDNQLIDVSLLTPAEITWINDYHRLVFDGISPLILDQHVKKWFEQKCAAI